jgi:uncharacterized protein YuzE
MKNKHIMVVHSSAAPVVEWDSDYGSVYIRFKRTKVARTLDREIPGQVFTVDLDKSDEVVGVEALFIKELEISSILKKASVKVPDVMVARAKIRRTPNCREEAFA